MIEPPIEPAIVLFAAAAVVGVVAAVTARSRWALVLLNVAAAGLAGFALVVLWGLMTH